MTPDDAILDALDDALTRGGEFLPDDELEAVLNAVCALPPSVWALLEARWRATQEAPVD